MDKKRNYFNVKDSSINFILTLLVPFIASFGLYVILGMIAKSAGMTNGEFSKSDFGKILYILYTPTVFFYIYYFYVKSKKIDVFKASEIKLEINWQKVIIVIIIGVVAVFLLSPFISLLDYFYSLAGYKPDQSLPFVMNNSKKLIVGILAMAAAPAFCEEILFRGLIFKGLQNKLSDNGAVVLSALMFTLLHGSLQQTAYQFILGVILGYVMLYGKSIIYPMLLHFVNNLIVVISSYVYTIKNIDVNLTPVYKSAWEIIYPIVLFLVAVAIIVGMIYVLKFSNSLEENLKNTSKNSSNLATNNINESIIDSNQAEKELTREESIYVWCSVGLGLLIWVFNTVGQFYGLL